MGSMTFPLRSTRLCEHAILLLPSRNSLPYLLYPVPSWTSLHFLVILQWHVGPMPTLSMLLWDRQHTKDPSVWAGNLC